ncbi:hypothetical protein BN14_07211 [Rhizoctonia solani AG-1 IB]|uniref:N-acetyltransferase domain-containing protein n=1 Tax=Thanatephorus cucumeris (strain AG1-IB / isolate 7/3/14) TaxID=1108050 RepID=M5C2B9_THACB|nr:hypothetical protein BN14_07211 [Rhizoctonia solani AG-1 IB]
MLHSNNYPYNPRYKAILQYNPTTDEPFIALPAPYSNIRLTPARLSDADAIPPIMNIPEVAMYLNSPPFPFPKEHGQAWLQESLRDYEGAMTHIRKVEENVGYIDLFPLRHIREIGPDGTETFLGDVHLSREDRFDHIDDMGLREAKVSENAILPPGDPSIVWSIGVPPIMGEV